MKRLLASLAILLIVAGCATNPTVTDPTLNAQRDATQVLLVNQTTLTLIAGLLNQGCVPGGSIPASTCKVAASGYTIASAAWKSAALALQAWVAGTGPQANYTAASASLISAVCSVAKLVNASTTGVSCSAGA